MRLFKKLLLGFAVLIAVFLAGAFLLPSQVEVSREIVINAPANMVFPHVNDLRKFQVWSPWGKIDPDMKLVYSGAETGKGQSVSWSSDNRDVGSGTQEITESVPDRRVATSLDFGGMGGATAVWDLTGAGSGTKVTWSFQTDLGMNPIMRWMGLMFDGWIGGEYETGLKALKSVVETQ